MQLFPRKLDAINVRYLDCRDARMCMSSRAYWRGKNRIVFLGDSRIRQMYNAFAKLVSIKENIGPKFAHHDMSFREKELNLEIEFLWHPVINSSMFEVYRKWLENDDLTLRPKIVVTGAATWSIRESNASTKALESYRSNLTRLLSSIESMGSSGTQVLWVLQDQVNPDKLTPDRIMITNEQIDLYNKASMDILKYSRAEGVHLWSSSRLVSQGYNYDQLDGLHMGDVALSYAVQILLNMYCNDQMKFNDGTCCSDPEPITAVQIITLIVFGICVLLAIAMAIHKRFFTKRKARWTRLVNQDEEIEMESTSLTSSHSNSHSDLNSTQLDMSSNHVNGTTSNSSSRYKKDSNCRANGYKYQAKSYYELINLLGRLGLITIYFFLCDRTIFFMKENKYFTHLNFFLPIAYVFAIGLFFTEESNETQVLHRDQTDEWKGWMQLVILTYHMTGASQVLPIYMNIRLLVSGYLFLSGYGHFTYFWNKGDLGLHRLWEVISRTLLY